MKKIASAILLTSLLSASCSQDFIDLPPISTVNVDQLYKTDNDFRDAMTGVYRSLQMQYQDFWIYGDVPGDDSEQQVARNDPWYFADTFTINNDLVLLNNTWTNYYVLITRANTILDRIEKVDGATLANRDRHIGEAKFLRALAYFDLVRIFGNVPMITSLISTEEALKKTRDNVATIYENVIIPDLLEAESRLPATYTGANVGRATKGAAASLLARVYMTRKDFVKAEEKLQQVTTMGYRLLANYNDLFDYSKNEHHSEYIFDVEYEEGLGGQGSVFTHRFMPNSTTMAGFYGIRGSELSETNSPTDELIGLFQQGDRRKDITVGPKGGFYNAQGEFIRLPIPSQTYTKKYITPVAIQNDSKANWKVIRYADVLLMYAEALNENGKTAQAVQALNQIRERAGVAAYTATTQADIRAKIALERRLELSFEGHRWFDLVRTGKALEVLRPKGIQDYMTIFPIPLNQIQVLNDRNVFPQNPGYD
ncbi:RagB/SusD family nutrient uptake outer membrane protein [Dyadobacter luteus]|jgi:tetratricopeptide (TPR) repeat protein|uniref:RagB/SusD family nutrient uptake outer membrane protein n=1 Tax=Dyadobacter luteus TaxID=2259619 RepID=A0A3D8YG98_9BACT|nr:RagB/SusD family nutrient uptake outer membrane protein [Dyadobacter luteus]REA63681.1 RagB/SusD family nutrient uptake outer membrane protein [Dyadobacter luteus]